MKRETRTDFDTGNNDFGDIEKLSLEEVRIEAVTDYLVDPDAERRLVRKIDLRIIPASLVLYTFSVLDRSNMGNAKLLNSDSGDSLLQTTHMTDAQYLIALVILLIPYITLEAPSNYLLKRFRPSRWLAFLVFSWGITTMLMAATHNLGGIAVLRFFLGVFEAGVFPGMVYCTTFWYKPNERALRVATFMVAAALGGGFGGAIAFAVGHMNRLMGLQGWKWLFILEGAPACAYSVFVFFFYPDYPETDKWLSPEERELATERIKGVASLGHHKVTWKETLDTFKDLRLLVHYVMYISIGVAFSSVTLFTPTVVAGLGYQGLDAQLFTVPPYAIASVVTLTFGWLSDRYEFRSWAAFVAFFMSGIGYIIQGALPPTAFKARYGMLCFGVAFSFSANAPLLSWLAENLHNTTASTLAIPLMVGIGQTGQIIGIFVYKDSEAPGFPTGHYTNGAFGLAGALMVLVLRGIYTRRNRQLRPGERAWRL